MGRDRYGEDERRRELAREWDEGPGHPSSGQLLQAAKSYLHCQLARLSAGQGGRAVTQTQARPQLSQGP